MDKLIEEHNKAKEDFETQGWDVLSASAHSAVTIKWMKKFTSWIMISKIIHQKINNLFITL